MSRYFFEGGEYFRLESIYNNQQYKIAAGTVRVLRIQPVFGHAPGDLIKINDTEFEINYYLITFGYSDSIAHGGVLKEGADVVVYYTDSDTRFPDQKTILRIDLKKQETQ